MPIQEKQHFSYLTYDSYTELSEKETSLIESAIQIAKSAYAPYSKFHVGAAALMDDGTILEANNQENIAYPSGMCAERVLLYYIGAVFPNKKVKQIAVFGNGDLVNATTPISPCGACRQVMAEFSTKQDATFGVFMTAKSGRTIHVNSNLDLLPFPFGV